MQLILSSSVERTIFFSLFLKSLNFLSPTESKRVFTGGEETMEQIKKRIAGIY